MNITELSKTWFLFCLLVCLLFQFTIPQTKTHICMCLHVHTNTCIHTWYSDIIIMYACAHVLIHTHTHTHTHVHTHARTHAHTLVCLFVGCLMSQQQACVSQGQICSDNFMCCHTETEVADQTFYLTQSQYTDTRQTSPSADPISPGTWQGSNWSANF